MTWPARRFGAESNPEEVVTLATWDLVNQSLQEHGLNDVHVTVNAYSPREEWERTKANTELPAYWKYSVGAAFWVGSTLLPNRVLNRNVYNPNSNTLAINSNQPFEILSEVAYARRFRDSRRSVLSRTLPQLPPISSLSRMRASRDVLAQAKAEGNWELERSGYEHVYSQMVGVGLEVIGVVPTIPFYVVIPAGLVGELGAKTIAKHRIRQREAEIALDEVSQVSGVEELDAPGRVILE